MTAHDRKSNRLGVVLTLVRLLVCTLLLSLISGRALAFSISLPNNSSGSCSGKCFSITNTLAGSSAIEGYAAGNGYGVYGGSSSGPGVIGTSTSGSAVQGIAYGTSGISVAVAGTCINTGGSSQCKGVQATIPYQTVGSAVYADAGNSGSAWAGYFVGDVSAVGYYNNSDARLKKNIKDLTHATESVLKLRPVKYQWTRDDSGAEQLGLIAQEVQKVFPNAVRSDQQSGMLSVNYIAMVPVLIKSTQEQQETIQRLESRIAALEGKRTPLALSSVMPAGSMLAAGTWLTLLAFGAVIRRRKES